MTKPLLLELNERDLTALAKALFIASWVSESSDSTGTTGIDALEQRVFALIHKFLPGLVEYDQDMKMYFVVPDKEEEWVENYIAPHDDEHLWESLQMELAHRDFNQEFSPVQQQNMSEDERSEKLSAALKRYSQEFAESGLQNLVIRKS